MPPQKLTPEQARRVEEIEEFLHAADGLKHLVSELEASRAAQTRVIARICETIARECSQLRQRALTAHVGTIADVAGTMSVMAARGGGINMKIRGLADGVNNLVLQLDQALKHAKTPAGPPRSPGPPGPKAPA